MIRHRRVQEQLYDYLQNEVSDVERRMIEQHLSGCKECSEVAASLRSSLKLVGSMVSPGDQLPENYWNSFADVVEQRVRHEGLAATNPVSLWESVVSRLMTHQRLATSLAGALAVLAVVIFLWHPWQPDQIPPAIASRPQVIPVSQKTDRVARYFRKSKVLLVGLSNLRTTENQPIDLSFEQRVSRKLVHETRSLREEGLDPHSALVVNDLEKILIELANIEQPRIQPQVEMIRNGIRQENLLFKLRMAESMRDSMRFTFAGNNE